MARPSYELHSSVSVQSLNAMQSELLTESSNKLQRISKEAFKRTVWLNEGVCCEFNRNSFNLPLQEDIVGLIIAKVMYLLCSLRIIIEKLMK